jgi:SAM-dependent methyltransferase
MRAVTTEEAIRQLRGDSRYDARIRDSYLEPNVLGCAERFLASVEFAEVQELLGGCLQGATVLDLGAGNGIASYAMAKSGAKLVFALEPDPSEEIGRGAISRLSSRLPIELIDSCGEDIPIGDSQVDIVYARQVLHHAHNLPRLIQECARVLKPGGTFVACREHIVDDKNQLEEFRRNHPVHRLTGGEAAYPLDTYIHSICSAGLQLVRVLGPWDSVINAFPAVRSRGELRQLRHTLLVRQFGRLGLLVNRLPGLRWLVHKWLTRPVPGRMYSFLATRR